MCHHRIPHSSIGIFPMDRSYGWQRTERRGVNAWIKFRCVFHNRLARSISNFSLGHYTSFALVGGGFCSEPCALCVFGRPSRSAIRRASCDIGDRYTSVLQCTPYFLLTSLMQILLQAHRSSMMSQANSIIPTRMTIYSPRHLPQTLS